MNRQPHKLTGACILIVDDDESLAALIEIALTFEGGRVFTAGSARDALKVLADHRIDVILSDIDMPQADGYWLVKAVRNSLEQAFRRIPAVAVTGLATQDDRARALNAGFDDHVTKPVDLPLLVERIVTLLKAHHRRQKTEQL